MIKHTRYELHIYSPGKVQSLHFSSKAIANATAASAFRNPDVYKVKLWDKKIGPITPNDPNNPALILHLV